MPRCLIEESKPSINQPQCHKSFFRKALIHSFFCWVVDSLTHRRQRTVPRRSFTRSRTSSSNTSASMGVNLEPTPPFTQQRRIIPSRGNHRVPPTDSSTEGCPQPLRLLRLVPPDFSIMWLPTPCAPLTRYHEIGFGLRVRAPI